MSDLIINSFFTFGGAPATGLAPTVRIWEVDAGTNNLVIGSPNGSILAVDGTMVPIVDAPSDDGFYKYVFTMGAGYDPMKRYIFRVDGGGTLPPSEQYQSGETVEGHVTAETVTSITGGVWDQDTASHLLAGSFGELIQLIKADTTAIFLCCDLVRKFQTNRTRIDSGTFTLTVYDDDKVTPLHVFNLKDTLGNPSLDPLCERDPC